MKKFHKEDKAKKAQKAQFYKTCMTLWEAAGLDAEKIWKAKLRNSAKLEVINLADRISKTGELFQCKSFKDFRELYTAKHGIRLPYGFPFYYMQDAIEMCRLSGLPDGDMTVRYIVEDFGSGAEPVPTSGKNWRLVR